MPTAKPAASRLLLAGLTLVTALLAPVDETPVADRIASEGNEHSRVMDHLDHLVNRIGPRLSGSSQLTESAHWAVEVFESFGLEARLEAWGEVPVGFERGPSHGRVLPPADGATEGATDREVPPDLSALTFITRAWTRGTDGPARGPARVLALDTDAVAALRDIEDRGEREAATDTLVRATVDAIRDDLPGAWVLLPRQARSLPPLRSALEAAAVEQDAHGLIYPSRESELLVMGGRMIDSMDEVPPMVWIELVAGQYRAIEEQVAAGQDVTLEFDIDNRFIEGPIDQFNVVADLVGTEFPDEYVIVSGHLDSWDGATGTNDNGTGVTSTIEAARLLTSAGARPRRTIRFILWTGEEQGLLGSRAWVDDNGELLDDISAVLVHDGGTNAVSGITVTPAMKAQADLAFADAVAFAETTGIPFSVEEAPGMQASGGSDHVPFIAAGVPAFFWHQTGDTEYRQFHHTQNDTYESARADYQRHTATVVALGALGLADLPDKLDRTRMVIPRRLLGVYMGDDGLTVRRAMESGQAHERGIRDGDVLVSIGGEMLTADSSLRSILGAGEPRKEVVWKRGDETMSAVFWWDTGDIDREPEAVALTTEDGVSIAGDYYIGSPEGPAAGSAVVLLHMNGADRHTWMPVRDELYRAGIATLAIDLRGHGESVDAAGELERRRLERDAAMYNAMEHDAAAAVAWLEEQGYPAGRIGLMGASVGCSVALRTATGDERLAGVCVLTPGATYLGIDSLADAERWDRRPLLIVSSQEELDRGSRRIHAAITERDAWAPVDLVILHETDVHGTQMFGKVDKVEQRLADWWTRTLK